MAGDIFPPLSGQMASYYYPYGTHAANLRFAPFDYEENPQPLISRTSNDVKVFCETNFMGIQSPDKKYGYLQGHIILDTGSSNGGAGVYLRQSVGFDYLAAGSGLTEISLRDRNQKAVVMWANIGRASALHGEAHASLILQFRVIEKNVLINNFPYDNIIGSKDWVGEDLIVPYGNSNYPFYIPDSIYLDTFKRVAGKKYQIWIDAYLSASVLGQKSAINVSYGLDVSQVEIKEA
jgi:hypothetical protein